MNGILHSIFHYEWQYGHINFSIIFLKNDFYEFIFPDVFSKIKLGKFSNYFTWWYFIHRLKYMGVLIKMHYNLIVSLIFFRCCPRMYLFPELPIKPVQIILLSYFKILSHSKNYNSTFIYKSSNRQVVKFDRFRGFWTKSDFVNIKLSSR